MKIHTAAVSAAALFTLISCSGDGVESASGGSDGLNRTECLAYILIDTSVQHEYGMISDQQYQDEVTKVHVELQNKGDNFNYANTYRILNNRIDEIIDGGVTPEDVAQKVEECRPIVHI